MQQVSYDTAAPDSICLGDGQAMSRHRRDLMDRAIQPRSVRSNRSARALIGLVAAIGPPPLVDGVRLVGKYREGIDFDQ